MFKLFYSSRKTISLSVASLSFIFATKKNKHTHTHTLKAAKRQDKMLQNVILMF